MQYPDAIVLKHGWRFALTSDASAHLPDYAETGFVPVTVPHDWQIAMPRDPNMVMGSSQGFYPRNQVGVYRLTLHAPLAWKSQSVRLLFDGCQRFYAVFVNGVSVGEKRYGYLPYLCDIASHLRYGEDNLISVRVNNADTLGDRWYSGAGLFRQVRLLVDQPAHIAPFGVHMTYDLQDDQANAVVHVRLENDGQERDATIAAVLTAPDGTAMETKQHITLPHGGTEVSLPMTVPFVQRWDMDTPNTYGLTVTLSDSDRVLDTVTERVGFRTISFSKDGFLLNGRAHKLYGVNIHHDGGAPFGAAVPIKVWRRRFQALKDIGCNAIRFSHNPHDEALYDLCDEFGFVAIDELYDKWYDSALYFGKLFKEDAVADLTAMIRRDINHPSIVLWSVGNEVEVQYSEGFYETLGMLRDTVRSLDPSRPVSAALIGYVLKDFGEDRPLSEKAAVAKRCGDIVDVFMGNYMEGYYDAIRAAGMDKPIIGSEVFMYYLLADNSQTTTIVKSPFNVVRENADVIGGFVWAGVDYLGESTGWPSKGWTGCPIDSTGYRKLRAAHMESQWKDTPVVRLAVFDDLHPWDMAMHNWSFPQMSAHWHHDTPNRMMHIAVMTNCDRVRLYLNNEHVREAPLDPVDRMAHFHVPFRKGTLRAVGIRDGQEAAEDALVSAEGPASIRLTCADAGPDIMHVDAELLDEHGQVYPLGRQEVRFRVEGNAVLLGIDNGDFVHDMDHRSGVGPFHLGHMLAVLRATASAGTCTVHAQCGNIKAARTLTWGGQGDKE